MDKIMPPLGSELALAHWERYGPVYKDVSHIGDVLFAASIILLLHRLCTIGSSGISVQTQIFQFLVLVTRYADMVFLPPISVYVTTMKASYILASGITLTILLSKTTSRSDITVRNVGPALIHYLIPTLWVAVWVRYGSLPFTWYINPIEIAWAFSQYLFAVQELPQFGMLYRAENRDPRLIVYVTFVAAWKVMYIPMWVSRALAFQGPLDLIAYGSSLLHIVIYIISMLVIAVKTPQSRIHLPITGTEDDKVVKMPLVKPKL